MALVELLSPMAVGWFTFLFVRRLIPVSREVSVGKAILIGGIATVALAALPTAVLLVGSPATLRNDGLELLVWLIGFAGIICMMTNLTLAQRPGRPQRRKDLDY